MKRPTTATLRALLADWKEDAGAHDTGMNELEPKTRDQARWKDEGYRRGILCAWADLLQNMPRERNPRSKP